MLVIAITTSASAEIYLRKDPQDTAKQDFYTKKAKPAPSQEQDNNAPPRDVVPSTNALDHANIVANACLSGQWATQPCLSALSDNNMVMASNYAAALSESAMTQSAENIKQHCAASTAASNESYPAGAMRSAFVECVNIIVDESKKSGITPDQSQFQLLFSAVQCLDGAPSCAAIEQGLSRYK